MVRLGHDLVISFNPGHGKRLAVSLVREEGQRRLPQPRSGLPIFFYGSRQEYLLIADDYSASNISYSRRSRDDMKQDGRCDRLIGLPTGTPGSR